MTSFMRYTHMIWLAMLACGFATVATAAQDPPDAQQALANLRANQPRAYEQVIAAGESAVDGLAQMLADRELEPVLRYAAANAMGDIGSKKAVAPLIAALKDKEFNIRRCAALALGKLRDPAAREPLVQLATRDPFSWKDPKTGQVHYLVREDAAKALEVLDGRATYETAGLRKEREIFMPDAAKLPPSPVRVPIRRLKWPFPGGFREQFIFNNYPQGTDAYVHAALDFIQKSGTEVRAVEDGYIAATATNYPEWKTHHFFVVTREKGGTEGWCYTHLDPDSYTFKPGDRIRQGQVLGKVVDFYAGKEKGADHLHLHYVRMQQCEGGQVDVQSLADPLLFFDYEDTAPPRIDEKVRFVREGTVDEFPVSRDGIATLRGKVDIIAGISDCAYPDQICSWAVPVITLEIKGQKTPPWRKLVLDHRGPIEDAHLAPVLYVSSKDNQRWTEGRPRFPVIYWLRLTRTDGDGVIEEADRLQNWDTESFPDGFYDITIRAWDLKGNMASRTVQARVMNASRPSSAGK